MGIISAKIPLLFISLAILFLLSIDQTSAQSKPFTCTSNIKECTAIVDYVPINSTTITAIKNLFNVKSLADIFGINNLLPTTPTSRPVLAKETIKIPIPCSCNNSTGTSNKIPIYKVVKDDGLFHIAAEIFSGLITYQEIQEANNIPDPNKIVVGQELWIPLPCSCDEVDGQRVLHYGHVVKSQSTVAGIAAEYNTTEDVLLRLNGLASPNDLKADSVLDVPLKVCTSSVRDNSQDYPLLVSNGTYVLTAGDCVTCRCDSTNNWTLQCQPSQFNTSIQQTCPRMQCEGSGGLTLGNSTSTGCERETCSYTGHLNNGTILTALEKTNCPASGNDASMVDLNIWRMSFMVIAFHFILFCIQFS